MPFPTHNSALKEINKLFFKFLWDGKGDKIKCSGVTSDFSEGGAKMLDITAFNCSLKVTWIKKYINPTNVGKRKSLFNFSLNKLGRQLVFQGNLDKKDTIKINVNDAFLSELLELWSDISFREVPFIQNDFIDLPLWNNSLIRVANKPVFYKQWANDGITKIGHLMNSAENCQLLNYQNFQSKYNIKTSFIQYYGIITSISKLRNKLDAQQPRTVQEKENWATKILLCKKVSRNVYKALIAKVQTTPENSQAKWERATIWKT